MAMAAATKGCRSARAGQIGDVVLSGAVVVGGDAGEDHQVGHGVHHQIENDRFGRQGEVAAQHGDAGQRVADVSDAAVSHEPFQVALGQCHQVAQQHGQGRQDGDYQLPLAPPVRRRHDGLGEQAQRQRKGRRFGADGQVGP